MSQDGIIIIIQFAISLLIIINIKIGKYLLKKAVC